MSDNLTCYCYGSRGMEEPTEIPYYTPERTEDPPGISFYTLQIPLYTKDERREDKGDNIANDDEYEDKPGMSFDSKII